MGADGKLPDMANAMSDSKRLPHTIAAMSLPRLGWNDFWGCAYDVLHQLHIPMARFTGAFWEQGLSRVLAQAIDTGAEYVLTLDYDTIFGTGEVLTLLTLAAENPEADAICPLQVARSKDQALLSVRDNDTGLAKQYLTTEDLAVDLMPVHTGHFGCTLIKLESLRDLPKPWMRGDPGPDGDWGKERIDPDITFWRNWNESGRSLFLAPRVTVGHLEVMIRWPDQQLRAIWQHPGDFKASGKPEGVWE
jgi:hypothetical protein